ncbi:MAG: hypothetical protein LBJ13_01575 [Puniceicoccales bacterium]|nr:hypothetical protein [Puniceicoccales bacterium]
MAAKDKHIELFLFLEINYYYYSNFRHESDCNTYQAKKFIKAMEKTWRISEEINLSKLVCGYSLAVKL